MKKRRFSLVLFSIGLFLARPVLAKSWPSDSLFQLNSSWQTQEAKRVKISDFEGHGYFVAMIFTSCRSVCPLLISDLKFLAKKLGPKVQKNIRFLLISIDPETDSPAVLKKYKGKMKLDDRWTLLNGKKADVTELAAALGFQFKENKIEKFTHSSSVYLMNGKGQVVAKQVQRMKNMDVFLGKASELFSK